MSVETTDPDFNLRKDFYKHIMNSENKLISLHVYSVLTQETRTVKIKPSRNWENADGLLGLKIRWALVTDPTQSIFRIVNIIPGSPASEANLVVSLDFIVGCLQFEFMDMSHFFEEIEGICGKEISPF